jgi:hypothetical protein
VDSWFSYVSLAIRLHLRSIRNGQFLLRPAKHHSVLELFALPIPEASRGMLITTLKGSPFAEEIASIMVAGHSFGMPVSKGPTQPPGSALRPLSGAFPSTEATPAQVRLPTDLPGSLKYLDNAQLERLQEAVAVEISRRNQGASLNETGSPKTTGTSSQPSMRRNKTNSPEDIPLAKANLVRASFKAGLKPAAIARNFRLPQSWVNRIVSGTEKPKR